MIQKRVWTKERGTIDLLTDPGFKILKDMGRLGTIELNVTWNALTDDFEKGGLVLFADHTPLSGAGFLLAKFLKSKGEKVEASEIYHNEGSANDCRLWMWYVHETKPPFGPVGTTG